MTKIYFFSCGLCGEISQSLKDKIDGCVHCGEGNPFMKNEGFIITQKDKEIE